MRLKMQPPSRKILEALDAQRGETQMFPVSPDSGWHVLIDKVEPAVDRKNRKHWRVILRALEDICGSSFSTGECGRELFYIEPDPAVSAAWQDVHLEKFARMCYAAGVEDLNITKFDSSMIIGKQVLIVVRKQKDAPEYNEIVDWLPVKNPLT